MQFIIFLVLAITFLYGQVVNGMGQGQGQDPDPEEQCDRFQCWTCLGEIKTEAECLEEGQWRYCNENEPLCEVKRLYNSDNEEIDHKRQCKQYDACHAKDAVGQETCHPESDVSACYNCTNVEEDKVARCNAEPCPNSTFHCWTCLGMIKSHQECMERGEWKACHQDQPLCEIKTVTRDNGNTEMEYKSQCMQFDACRAHGTVEEQHCEMKGIQEECYTCNDEIEPFVARCFIGRFL